MPLPEQSVSPQLRKCRYHLRQCSVFQKVRLTCYYSHLGRYDIPIDNNTTPCADGSYCCGYQNASCCPENGGSGSRLEIFYKNPAKVPLPGSIVAWYEDLAVSTNIRRLRSDGPYNLTFAATIVSANSTHTLFSTTTVTPVTVVPASSKPTTTSPNSSPSTTPTSNPGHVAPSTSSVTSAATNGSAFNSVTQTTTPTTDVTHTSSIAPPTQAAPASPLPYLTRATTVGLVAGLGIPATTMAIALAAWVAIRYYRCRKTGSRRRNGRELGHGSTYPAYWERPEMGHNSRLPVYWERHELDVPNDAGGVPDTSENVESERPQRPWSWI